MAGKFDVVVVGGGVNGMVASLLCRQRGLEVLLLEAHSCLGGGVRTKEFTLEGFRHDVCSAVHPFGRSSPILRDLELEEEGLEWVDPEVPLAHPLLGEESVILSRCIEETANSIGSGGKAYRSLLNALTSDWPHLEKMLLGPVLGVPPLQLLPRLARFGLPALTSASFLGRFLGRRGAALWAGLAAHSLLPMETLNSSAVACVLGTMAHRVGWPIPKGGAQSIAIALERKLVAAGVEIRCESRVDRLGDLPEHTAVIYDLTAKPLLSLLGPRLSSAKRWSMQRYKSGPGVFKLDYALSEPVPWSDPSVARAGTIHLGGELSEIARGERAVWKGRVDDSPFLLAVQPSLFDSTRAPEGQHTFWVYLHTPNGWTGDATDQIESQIERYAPGFRDVVLKRHSMNVADFESYNPNYVGGDILGGANFLSQIVARPYLAFDPYHLGGNAFCCSASVPPGGGIHGMGGYHAAQSVIRRFF